MGGKASAPGSNPQSLIPHFPFTMRFFLAGIMQGSHTQSRIHDQDYRQRIARLLEAHFPHAEIYDPRVSTPSRWATTTARAGAYSFITT